MTDSTETTPAARRDEEIPRPPGVPRWLKVSAIVSIVVIAAVVLVMVVGGHDPGGRGPGGHMGSLGAADLIQTA